MKLYFLMIDIRNKTHFIDTLMNYRVIITLISFKVLPAFMDYSEIIDEVFNFRLYILHVNIF